MRKSRSCEINWNRLAIVVAVTALAAALWTSQWHAQAPAERPVATVVRTDGPPEAQAHAHPQDPAGWRALGGARFASGQYADAVVAYQQAVALAPGNAVTWSALGEARVMASPRDPMPAEALKDFHAAATIDAKEPRARYFLAVAKDLTGDHAGAIADWLALLHDTPPGAPWDADLRRTIEQVGRINHIAVAARIAAVPPPAGAGAPPASPLVRPPMADLPGPTNEDLAAASSIPPSQQQAMAQAMVARLEQRLAADPHNTDGWVMLIRSRMTLDGPAAASAVLARAVVADAADAARLRAAASAQGMK